MTTPTFVGREDELAFLFARQSEAMTGHPQTVLLEGPGGVGKSALLSCFARRLPGGPPLTASGDEAETFLSFGILLQLLDSRAAPWSDPFAAGAELLQFLDHRHAVQPTVFVVDDAHLADADSMTALTFALRRLQADRVMAVFAIREESVDHVPPGLLRLVEAQGGRLKLAGLTDSEVVEFGAARGCGRMSRRAGSRLREHTGGTRSTSVHSSTSSPRPSSTRPVHCPRRRRMPFSCWATCPPSRRTPAAWPGLPPYSRTAASSTSLRKSPEWRRPKTHSRNSPGPSWSRAATPTTAGDFATHTRW